MSLNEDYFERHVPKFDPGEPPEPVSDEEFIEDLSDEQLDKLIEYEKGIIRMHEEEMIRRENEREHKREAQKPEDQS